MTGYYTGDQLMFFSVWVPDPESTTRNLKRRIDTLIVQRSELRLSLGEGIYAVCPG
jgi:hypothetical protein